MLRDIDSTRIHSYHYVLRYLLRGRLPLLAGNRFIVVLVTYLPMLPTMQLNPLAARRLSYYDTRECLAEGGYASMGS